MGRVGVKTRTHRNYVAKTSRDEPGVRMETEPAIWGNKKLRFRESEY